MAAHHEVHLEEYIVKMLLKNGWVEGKADKYDKQRALYPEDVIAWAQTGQKEAWAKLVSLNGHGAENVLLDRLVNQLSAVSGGTMKVLREGIDIAGTGKVQMSQRAPEDNRNDEVSEKYNANILRVVRQLKYNPTREFALDLCFFINGIPVSTVEIKTDFTQSIEDAVKQYKQDRKPVENRRKEPLLTFKRGAVVHFAMSDSEIQMATRLEGADTFFLPFNKGNNGHAGNPSRNDGEYPVAYFWEEICQRDNWLRIFHNFVYVQKSEKIDKNGIQKTSETLIFPRYHQLEAVTNMVQDAKKNGPGMQYLCEHSAGSGKTSTIAWTAHDLTKLRHPDGKPYFNTVIIVTDRNVLDSQLQDAVRQLDHQYGMISAIDRSSSSKSKSKQLAEALIKGSPIVIVTIQTFPHAMDLILDERSLKDRNYAIIIDEAHTSQGGSNASGMNTLLVIDDNKEKQEMSVDEYLLKIQESRVQAKTISHFAFTATPKHTTMTLFGRLANPDKPEGKDNTKVPFHKYTQRQAIEEGFILDVLENYTNYQTAFKIGVNIAAEEDRRVDKKQARKAIAQWGKLHASNVTQKVHFIMEHFMQNVSHLLNGEAKAMVVTSSRAAAVKYKLAFDQYIEKEHITGIQSLVAFSGKVNGSDCQVDGDSSGNDSDIIIDAEKEYSEYNLNLDVGNQDLRHVFDQQEYKVMIVANKFQTGFNQPKLVALYLDKKISDVDAVQTLSRLNRTYPGKDTTFVIDFANEPEEILKAFKKYDTGAVMEDIQDLNVVYDKKNTLDEANIYVSEDLENFKKANPFSDPADLRSVAEKNTDLHKRLYAATERPTVVFNKRLSDLTESINNCDVALAKADNSNDKKTQEQLSSKRTGLVKERESLMLFKKELARFVRVYSYIAQLVSLADPELENFAGFAKLLSKRLKGISVEQIDLTGLVLSDFSIKKRDYDMTVDDSKLKSIGAGGFAPSDKEKEFLSQVVDRLNKILGDVGDNISQYSAANEILNRIKDDESIASQIANNTKEQAMEGDVGGFIKKALLNSRGDRDLITKTILSDKQIMGEFTELLVDMFKTMHEARGVEA